MAPLSKGQLRAARKAARAAGLTLDGDLATLGTRSNPTLRPKPAKRLRSRGKTWEQRNADRIDGYDRDDLGESPDY